MGRDTLYELTDRQYLRLDGENRMSGQIVLPGDPSLDNHAVRKAYADTLFGRAPTDADIAAAILILTTPGGTIDARIAAAAAAYLPLAGGTMTGVLTLAGAPVNPLEAATMAYADLMLPLAGGLMGGVLTLAADPLLAMQAATMQYVDAVPPGQPIYDAIVDAAGGVGSDYTSIATACAGQAAGARIYIVRGTYNEAASIEMKDGQMLEGQNPEDTIIDFGAANRKITFDGAGTNRVVKNLTIQESIADYTVEMNGTYDRVENCRIIGTVNANTGLYMSGLYSIAKDNYIFSFTKNAAVYALVLAGNYGTAYGNTIITCRRGIHMSAIYCLVQGNSFSALSNTQIYTGAYGVITGNSLNGNIQILIDASICTIVGNNIRGDINWPTNDYDHINISSNHFNGGGISCNRANVDSINIIGNVFNGGFGVDFGGMRSIISNNIFNTSAHLQFMATAKWNTAVGNSLEGSTEVTGTRINDLGMRGNTARSNTGVPATSEKQFQELRNASGVGLVDGDVVVWAGAASGDDVTTTVNQGDDQVAGVYNEAVANGQWAQVQTLGKMITLKVNGVINIAIGDLLGTFTAAGISMQAQAGDMAFAVALEAYAGADSLGVIDALLVTPRKV